MNYYPIEEDINSTIANATPADFVYLPEGIITTPIIINNSCTIIGQETTINASVTINEDCDLSNINITNPGNTGLYAHQCSPSISNINSTGQIAFRIESCGGLEAESLKATNSDVGFEIKNSYDCTFRACVAESCNLGWNIEGSSSIVGDAYGSHELGLDFESVQDLTPLPDHTTFNLRINTVDYQIITTTGTTFNKLTQLINSSQGAGLSFSSLYNASVVDGDIRITSLQSGSNVELERAASNDIFYHLLDKKERNEIQTIETLGVADLGGKHFLFESQSTEYYVYYQSNGFGDVQIPGKTAILVVINAFETAESVALKTATALSGVPGIDATSSGDVLIIEASDRGVGLNLQDVDTTFTFNITQPGLIGVFGDQIVGENQSTRTDRSHNNEFDGCMAHTGDIGVRLINANDNVFQNFQSHSNSNVGIWQMPTSYSNIFRGELYNNANYGARNTDKTGGLHILDVSSTWWGHITGPSGSGNGQGTKISNYTKFEPWLRSGTEPIQPYPRTRDWIWRMLGDPIVRVELSEEHISDSIDMALTRYTYFRDWKRTYEYISVGEGQTEAVLPLHVPRSKIIEVSYSPNSQMFQQLTGAGEAFFLTYYLQQTGGTFASDFYLAMAYKETMERTLGIHPTYEFVSHNDETGRMRDYIRLYPRPSIGLSIGILYARALTEEEVDNDMWIKQYALSWAKEQLGRIRSKFATVPGPTGEISLDGPSLISEAQQERERLEQSIIDRGEPLSFSIG